ncbi:MAG: amino acid adenylation domain-containing protein [Phycisphaeraceae bacterium]|nr:amino acid adenylation domain-containing protein [Phycisphaeraceae bacterium]MBX3368434.1 amino acid adenylation domain-containing protein [Phycisphaeraceae bacterium]
MAERPQLRNIEDIYPATPMQEAMLFDALYGAGGAANLEQFTFLIRGPLDTAAYREAWRRVVHRHQALRARFAWPEGERPLQAIAREVDLPWTEEDWTGLTADAARARLDAFLLSDRRRYFDVSKPPLIRFVLVRLGPDLHRLIWTFHHILVDAWSVSIILGDVDKLYSSITRGVPDGLPPAKRLRDVVAWIAAKEADPAWNAGAKSHFAKALSGYDTLTPLPFRRSEQEAAGRSAELSTSSVKVTGDEYEALRSAARSMRVTIGTLILGAWGLVMARHAMSSEPVFGMTVSARPIDVPDVDAVVGLVMNALPIRTGYTHDSTVAEYLQTIQSQVRASAPYEQTRLRAVQEACGMTGREGLFDSLVILANYPLDDARRDGSATLTIEEPKSYGWAVVPMQFMVMPWKDLEIEARYDAAAFDRDRVREVLGQFAFALRELSADPSRPLREVPVLSPEDRAGAMSDTLRTTHPRDRDATIVSAFHARAAKSPDAVAYRFGKSSLTYAELDARSAGLASDLMAAGVTHGAAVGVCVEVSLDLPVALLGVLRAGASYVPLDPTYPKARLSQIVEDAKPAIIVASSLGETVIGTGESNAVRFMRIDRASRNSPGGWVDVPITPNDAAYIIYTSGSTGKPKGVRGTHRGAINRFEWMYRTRPFQQGERTCWCTTINFVDHVWEVFGPMLAGIETVVIPQEIVKDPRALVDHLAANRVSRLVVVPALLEAILDHAPDLAKRVPSLRIVVSSGEALAPALAARLLDVAPRIELVNLYGSSEVAADVLAHSVTREDIILGRIPLGKPIDNAAVLLLDHDMQPSPPGSPGMIYVGGDPLADGYHGRPDLTAERFFPNPFPELGVPTIFKTGDLARRSRDGVVEYMGRADYQVKVRGFRIEIGDVEQAIIAHPEVGETVVIARRQGNDNRLIAYVAPRKGSLDAADLRRYIQSKLPPFMVPSEFVVLEALPRTPNGKIDRAALPDPTKLRAGSASDDPAPGSTAAEIVSLYRQVLGREGIGQDDGFFDLGGHSLLAVKLFALIEDKLKRRLPLATLMAAPTPRELAAVIDADSSDDHRSPLVPVRATGSRTPFFCVHGMDGDVLFLQRLLSVTSPDQPIYGLQARGMDGVEQPQTSVEEMAATYEKAIRQVQPEGPYVIGGYSLGGMIALEIAHRLAQRGETVERLVILDTRVPRVVGQNLAKRTLVQRLRWHFRNGPVEFVRKMYIGVVEVKAYKALKRFNLPIPRSLRRLDTRYANLKAYFTYAPRPWGGKTSMLLATIQEEMFQNMGAFGWEHIAIGGLDLIPVECDHANFFGLQTINNVGEAFERVLADACTHDAPACNAAITPPRESPAGASS